MKLTTIDFANSFGENENEIAPSVRALIEENEIVLSPIIAHERDMLLVEIIQRIRNDKQVIASSDRTSVWEKGWGENLELFRNKPDSDAALVPKFVRPEQPIRWFQKYYRTNMSNFELTYIHILRQFVITKYFAQSEHLYEFGAGTGFNLLHANKLFPQLKLIGTDFVRPAVDLMNEVGVRRGLPLRASLFNMLSPELEDLRLKPNSAVWTFGSIEQLGGRVTPMINFLIENRPNIVVHIEPVAEFYEKDSLEDYLAKWFQTKRGYTEGLIKILNSHQDSGNIEILKSHRLNFGSLMMEGYNLIIWRTV